MAGNLETIKTESMKIASELTALTPVVEDMKKLVEAVEEKTESDKSFQERLEELVQKADPEVLSLLGEIRDRPPVDLSKIEELLSDGNLTREEILEAIRSGEAADHSGIEGKLDGIKGALDGIADALGAGEGGGSGGGGGGGIGIGGGDGWDGLGDWGKPDSTDEMALEIDLDDEGDAFEDALEKLGLDPQRLKDGYRSEAFSTTFRLPVSGHGTNLRFESFSFNLDEFSVSGTTANLSDVGRRMKVFIKTILQALVSGIFLTRVYRLIWR